METPWMQPLLEKVKRTLKNTRNAVHVVETMEKSPTRNLIGRNASTLVPIIDLLDRKESLRPSTKSTKCSILGQIVGSSGTLIHLSMMDSKTQDPLIQKLQKLPKALLLRRVML